MSRKQNILFTIVSAIVAFGALGYVLIASDFFVNLIANILILILKLI